MGIIQKACCEDKSTCEPKFKKLAFGGIIFQIVERLETFVSGQVQSIGLTPVGQLVNK